MAIHLPSAIATVFSTDPYIQLVIQHRCPIPGYRVLEDLVIGDVFIHPLSLWDILYDRVRDWDTVYIPTPEENYVLFPLCFEYPIDTPLYLSSTVITTLHTASISLYSKWCIAICIALKKLQFTSIYAISTICRDILSFMKHHICHENTDKIQIYLQEKQYYQNKWTPSHLKKISEESTQ